MVYKSKQTWKDLIDKPHHTGLTRRDLIRLGMATGVLTAIIPEALLDYYTNRANAQALTCPPATRATGAIAQIYAQGGPTMGARFIGEDQAGVMNATIAANYGITGTNLKKLGSNLVIDTTSPFGATLLQGPPGFPGGSAAWQTTVLAKISGGGHRGPFNSDDGAGANTGLIGGVTPFKATQMGKDLRISVSNKMAIWAGGLPNASIDQNNLTTSNLAKLFTLTPAATGLTSAQSMTNASNAAVSIASALGSVFNNTNRNGSSQLTTSAGCALAANSTIADPTFGTSLFTPANISALTTNVTVGSLSSQEQALLASYYQSALGVIGGVAFELGGRDYHGQSPQTVIAPADIEEARAIVMFLAACYSAQTRGAFIYLANGQAIASGVQSVPATIGGTAVTVNAPVAKGDAGGAYNAGLIIFFDPAGAPPAATISGTISSTSGNASTDPVVTNAANAVAGLYLSALKWINNGTIPPAAQMAMGIASPTGLVVI